MHNPPTVGASRARHPIDRTTDRAGGDWGGRPRPTIAGTRSARAARTPHRHRRGGTGLLKRGAIDSDGPTSVAPDRPSRWARKLIQAAGASRRAARGLKLEGGGADRAWREAQVPTSRARSGAHSPTRITAATGPPLKSTPGPGSHRDGLEACSPGEVRAQGPVAGRARKGRQSSSSTARTAQSESGTTCKALG